MRPIVIAALVTLIAFPLCAQNREVKQYPIEDFLDTEAVTGASFSPDDSKVLVSSDASGVFNAYAIPVDGSPRTQLTTSTTESVFAVSYFPEDERFLFNKDRGGNERTHIYVQYPDGRGIDLTPGDDVKASFLKWADDNQSFYITSNARDPRFFDLIEISIDDFSQETIFENTEGYNIANISADERYIALERPDTRRNTYAAVHDRETGETRDILQTREVTVRRPQHFDPVNNDVLALTDLGHEFLYLVRQPLREGEEPKVELSFQWDIQYARLSETGRYTVIGVNEDSISKVRIVENNTGRIVPLPNIEEPGVTSVRFSNDDTAVAFYAQGGRSPGDLYYAKLSDILGERKLTNRLSDKIDIEDLVKPRIVRFPSYDGVEIPGILYKPHQAAKSNKLPALVYVHGGPGGQTRASYNPLIQYLVNHGYVVFGINNRGSSGYGKTFYAMDDGMHGSADLDDCVSSKVMLADLGYVDPDRIGIIGGSYGGYMVCAALAFRPKEFEVGVNIFGVTNWVRTLKSIPDWWTAGRNALYTEIGDPNEQEDYLRDISPLFHADKIEKPMIVLQGANDPRVLKVESDEIVEALRANDVPVEYVVFEDEGHGFRKKENQITGYKAILDFLETHLAE